MVEVGKKSRRRKLPTIRTLKPRSYTWHETKVWAVVEQGKTCQLPSCGKERKPEEFSKHHWDFQGQNQKFFRDPSSSHLIHLVCEPCHDTVHKIAFIIVRLIQDSPGIEERNLISRVALIDGFYPRDINFVLERELKRAQLVRLEGNEKRCFLTEKGQKRTKAICQYVEIKAPELVKLLEVEFRGPCYKKLYNFLSRLRKFWSNLLRSEEK